MRLSGVTVLDFTRLLPGPYATQLLADLGADVLKIERPGVGDPARAMAAGGGPDVFGAVNRGKRSLTVDLKTEAGRAAALELAADADVVVEGFRPGVVDRLGVGYDDVSARNPAVVYCSLSGFGATGPDSERAGHDLNYQAMTGLLDMTRAEAGGRPAIPGIPVADMAGGLYAALGILAALLDRELGEGGGEHLDVALADSELACSQAVTPAALAGADPAARETPLTGQYPCYDVYEAADGRWMALAALEPEYWAAFCETVDRPDLADRHLSQDPAVRAAVREAVAEVFAERPRDEWEALLGDADVMVAPVRTVAEALDSDQVRARDLVRSGPDGRRVGLPLHSSEGRPETDERVPDLGADTESVLREHGHDDADVAALRDQDAI